MDLDEGSESSIGVIYRLVQKWGEGGLGEVDIKFLENPTEYKDGRMSGGLSITDFSDEESYVSSIKDYLKDIETLLEN